MLLEKIVIGHPEIPTIAPPSTPGTLNYKVALRVIVPDRHDRKAHRQELILGPRSLHHVRVLGRLPKKPKPKHKRVPLIETGTQELKIALNLHVLDSLVFESLPVGPARGLHSGPRTIDEDASTLVVNATWLVWSVLLRTHTDARDGL